MNLEDLSKLFETKNYDILIDNIRNINILAPESIGSIFGKDVSLYRSTSHHKSIPENIQDISYPPSNLAKLSRANKEGNPIFYCSPDANCTLYEINFDVNRYYVLSEWKSDKDIFLHDIGYIQKVFDRSQTKRVLSKHSKKNKINKLREYLHLAFTESDKPNYSFTAAIAEDHLNGDYIFGIRYPSIKRNSDVDNFALKTDFVDQHLTLIGAKVIKITKINKDESIEGKVIATLKKISENEKLIWNFTSTGDIIPPKQERVLKLGINEVQTYGEISINGSHYKIKPGYTIENINNEKIIIRNLIGEII